MIIYFSAAGNSKFIADLFGDCLNDEVVSLNDMMKNKVEAPVFKSEKPFVVCFPIFIWNVPPRVKAMLLNATFEGNRDIYFVPTMGKDSGSTYVTCQQIAAAQGLNYRGYCAVTMPDTYIEGFDMRTPEQAAPIIRAGAMEALTLAKSINQGFDIFRSEKGKGSWYKSVYAHNRYLRKGLTASSFVADRDKCKKCGACVEFCPNGNITLDERGFIRFGDNCMSCYGCLQRCKHRALNQIHVTEERRRYVCPDYYEWKRKYL